ncbi:MAG: hypothetical protein AAFN08_08175 [Cyanobacteria bacterium J06559_3]
MNQSRYSITQFIEDNSPKSRADLAALAKSEADRLQYLEAAGGLDSATSDYLRQLKILLYFLYYELKPREAGQVEMDACRTLAELLIASGEMRSDVLDDWSD